MNYKILLSGVKKTIIFFTLIFLLISQTNIWVVYAQNVAELESQKDASIELLQASEDMVEETIKQLKQKWSSGLQDRLNQKEKEIKDLLDKTEKSIRKTKSKKDIDWLLSETKKRIELKVKSWNTRYKDIDAWVPENIKASKKKKARDTIEKSLKNNKGQYKLILKTSYDKTKVENTFTSFDADIKIKKMYELWEKKYYQILVSNSSLFREEILEEIELWKIPEQFSGVEIVFPEVFSVESIQWEDLSQTWWIQEYQTYNYFDSMSAWSQVRVWVVDTGIDYNHPDLSENVSGGYDFVNDDADAMDDQGHGTHVAGTIAANINGIWIIWVNPYVELVPLKICNSSGFCPSYAVISALEYIQQNDIDVVNMSLGWRGTVLDNPICDGIQSVSNNGVIVVSASGNSNIDTSYFIPGWCDASLTVWAYGQDRQRASFSNYGSKVDVAAPWVSVYSTYPWNQYRTLSGTSMATPHIAGLVSIMKSENPSLTTSQVKDILEQNSIPLSTDKTIASAVDIVGVMDSFKGEEIAVSTEKNKVIKTKNKKKEKKDKSNSKDEDISIIDSSIDFETIPEIIEINLNPEWIEINNQEDEWEPIPIDEVVESSQEVSLEWFTKPEPWSIEINSEDLPEIEITEVSPEEFDTTKVKELYIVWEDGTTVEKSDIQINSIEDSGEELVEFEVDLATSTWVLGLASESVQINLTGEKWIEISNNEPLEPIEEVLEESDIEINSLDDNAEPIEEIIELDVPQENKILNLSWIESESGVKINTIWNEELIDIEEVVVWEMIIEEEEFEETTIEINSVNEEFLEDDGWMEIKSEESDLLTEWDGFEDINEGTIIDDEQKNLISELWDTEVSEWIEINNLYPTTNIRPNRIRYVRDWLSGSNKNGWNFWVEIQAIERNTWINKAEWIIPVWTRVESETRPYSKITDWSINTYDYAYGWWSLQNVTIDLWENHDIWTVNVWHYYADKRIFNKTKTEVSEDGVTWYVLHDSNIDGTYAESGSWKSYGLEEIITTPPTTVRYIRDFINRSNRNWGNHWLEIEAIERTTWDNVAEWKSVISNLPARYDTRPFSRITDGSKVSSEYAEGLPYRKVWVMIDLEDQYQLDMVKVWHYYYDWSDGRSYYDTKTEVSSDGIHWYILHDSEINGTYVEPKNWQWITYELRNTINTQPSRVRYIRDHANGSNKNGWSHWIELQAYDENGVNVAKWKPVTARYPSYLPERPYSRLTDGWLSYRTSNGKYPDMWMQVDLWELYDLDILKVWHYYADGRTYKDTKTEISEDWINWYSLHDSAVDGTYAEPSDSTGKIYLLKDGPIQKSCVINASWVGNNCVFPLHQASRYDYVFSNPDIATANHYNWQSLRILGKNPGSTKLEVKQDWITYYEFDVEVVPAHATHNASLDIGETLFVQLPDADRYDLSVSNGWLITYKSNSREVHVSGMNAGNTKLYLKYKWVLVHTVDIDVKSVPQDGNIINLNDKTVKEWLFTYYKIWSSASTYRYTVSEWGIISTHVNYDKVYIKWIKTWNVTLYIHDDNRWIIFTVGVTVIENTDVKRVRCDIIVWWNCDIQLNDADTYNYTVSRLGHVSYAKNSSLLRVTWENSWNTILYVKTDDGSLVYQIDVYVRYSTQVYDIDLFEWQEMQMYLTSAYNHDYSMTKKWIVWLYTTQTYVGGDYMYIKWYKAWNTIMYIQRWSWMIALNINVTEKPKEYECTIEVGMRCYLNLYRDYNLHKYVKFEVANREIIQQTWWETDSWDRATIIWMSEWIGYFSVQGIDVWKTHHLKVKVVPLNTINIDWECELDIGENCRVRLRDTWEHEMTVSTSGVVSAFRTNNEYTIYWVSEWSTKIYLKKDWVIVYTIYVEVSDIQNLSLGTIQMSLETREEDYFIITRWNWDYRIYKDNDNVSVYATSDEKRYRVYANKPWTTKVFVYDKENRFDSFTVYVAGDDEEEVFEDDAEIVNNIVYTQDLSTGDIGWMYFEVGWNPTEVWIEYTSSEWVEIQTLQLQEDWVYVVAFSQETCDWCNNFKPYAEYWNDRHYAQEETFVFNYTWDNIGVANAEEDWVEINSFNLNQFKENLSWVLHFSGWKSAFNQAKYKVVDVKDKYWDSASLVVSIIPVVWEWYDIITLIDGRDPITREPLWGLAKALTFVWLASWYGSWKAARDAWEAALQKIATDLWMTVHEITQIASEVAGEYKIHSIQDILDLRYKLNLDLFIKNVKNKSALIKIKRLPWRVEKPNLEIIYNTTLKNIVSQNYRVWATIWNWSTADAIRYTKLTWELVWGSDHIIKGISDSNGLKKLLDSWKLSNLDSEIANKIYTDLINALNNK